MSHPPEHRELLPTALALALRESELDRTFWKSYLAGPKRNHHQQGSALAGAAPDLHGAVQGVETIPDADKAGPATRIGASHSVIAN